MELIKVYQQTTGWSDALVVLGMIGAIASVIWLIGWLMDDYVKVKLKIIPAVALLITIGMCIGANYLPERTLETYQVTDQKQYLQMLNNGYHEYSSDELTVTVYRDDK